MTQKSGVALDTAKIRTLRTDAGLTLAQASKLMGVSGSARWSDIETGRKANVTVQMLGRIASALKVDPRELLSVDAPAAKRRRQK